LSGTALAVGNADDEDDCVADEGFGTGCVASLLATAGVVLADFCELVLSTFRRGCGADATSVDGAG
jgi:hypothetical protein